MADNVVEQEDVMTCHSCHSVAVPSVPRHWEAFVQGDEHTLAGPHGTTAGEAGSCMTTIILAPKKCYPLPGVVTKGDGFGAAHLSPLQRPS